ncbi:MAG TPA: hypothetical protein VGI67_12650 [Thermoleophilaceae bacterium]
MSDAAHEPLPEDDGDVRHLPVPSSVPEARPIERPAPAGGLQAFLSSLPAPAVAAAGGFLMGVVTWVAIRVLRGDSRRSMIARRNRRKGVEVAATRSFLVDVHLLKDR